MKFAFGVSNVQIGLGCFVAWRGVSPASLVRPPSFEQKFRRDLVSHLPDGLDKKMVFHISGDTGGVKNPAPQQLVASAMEADATDSAADGEAAFFYHLGDVVYYNGLTTEYYPQFYLPYEHYPLSILGIPGNHDAQLGAIGRGAGAEGKDLIASSRVGRRLGKAGRIELRAMPPNGAGLMVSRPVRRRHGPAPSLWLGKLIPTTIDMSK
jgi:hypothetical protein